MANEQYGVSLTADSTQYQQSLQQSTSATNALTDALGRASQAIQGLWAKGNRRLSFIAAGEVAAITAMTVAAGNLDQQMSQLQAHQVMLNRGTNDYDQTVKRLRRTFGQTSGDVVGLITQMNQLQVPFRQQEKTVGTYMKLAAVTGENVNGLAQAQQSFMRSMGANQRSVENYSAMMAKLQASTGASATATADFATSIAPLSKTVGMTAQQVAGISASFVKSGADGNAAANVYTKMLSDINRATQYGSPDLKTYSDLIGVSVDRFKEMSKSEAITQIFENLNAQGPRAIKTLEQLGLEGVRSQRAVNAVVQQGRMRQTVGTASSGYSDTDTFQKAAKQATDGLNDSLAKLRESLAATAQGFGSIFVPAVTGAVQVMNALTRPMAAVATFMNSIPDWAKTAAAGLAALGVAMNFLPRIALGLMGLTGISQVLRGPMSLGVRAGFRPGNLNEVQRNLMSGQGAAGPTALFASGQRIGQNLRPRTWVERWGGPEALKRYEERLAAFDKEGFGAGARGAATGGMRFAGSIARSMLLPWQPGYMNDPSKMHLNPRVANMMVTSRGTFEAGAEASNLPAPLKRLAKWMDLPGDKMRQQYVDATSNAMAAQGKSPREISAWQKDFNDKLKQSTEELKKHSTVTRTAASETVRFGRTVGSAALGAGGGAARLAGRGIGMAGAAVGRGLAGMASTIGPLGLAMGGVAAIGAMRAAHTAGIEGGKIEPGEDVGAGSTYRQALSIASRAVMSFAEVVERNSKSIDNSVSSVSQAILVSRKDIEETAGRNIMDENVKKLSGDDLQNYITNSLFGATPQEAQALKYDVVAKFRGNPDQAARMLSGGVAPGAQLTGMYGAINSKNQDWGPFGLINQQFGLSASNQQAVQMASSTAQNQMATIMERQGPAAAARFQQSQVSGLLSQSMRAATRNGGFQASQFSGNIFGGTREAEGRQQALRQFMGIADDDEESKKALNAEMERYAREVQAKAGPGVGSGGIDRATYGKTVTTAPKLTPDEEKAQARDFMSRLAQSDTDIGRQMKASMDAAGLSTNVGFSAASLAEDPLSIFGNAATRGTMAMNSTLAQRLFTSGNPAQSDVIAALTEEGNVGKALYGTQSLTRESMQGGRVTQQSLAEIQAFGSAVGAANPAMRAIADAAEAAAMKLRSFDDRMGGRTTIMDRARQARGDYDTALTTFRQNPNDQKNVDRLMAAKDTAEAAADEINNFIQGMAEQYRVFDIQREQGEEALQRQQERGLRDYNIQRTRAEDDFSTQRSRAYSDFHTQRDRAEADFNKQRSREEEDHKLQIVRMAEDAAKSVYDIYHRVGTQQTWDAQSLLSNMAEQQGRIGEQQANLAAVRKLGLSNKTISQLGLNESGNSQQLARLLQGLQEDPRLVAQYNQMAGKRQGAAGELMQDPSNTAFARSEADRKKNLKRSGDDFDESMERSRKDFGKQMSRSMSDFNKMRTRQQDDMYRSFADMNDDFKYQMDIAEKNISLFAEQNTKSFDEAYQVVAKRTQGLTKKQVTDMGTLMTKLSTVVKTDIKDMNNEIMKPFASWNVEAHKKDPSVSNIGNSMGGYAPNTVPGAGGPDDSTDYTALGGGGGGGANDNKHGWPLKSHRIGTPWGKRGSWSGSRTLGKGYHSGDDFPAPGGTAIHAAEDGEVVFTGWGGAYGNMTKIAHGNGVQTWYAHQSHIGTKKGRRVDQGDVIGKVGETGRAFGTHLHFEVRVNGKDIDPKKWLGGATNPTGGGGGGVAPDPHFADGKAYKNWEEMMGNLGYFNKKPQSFHAGSYWNKGELAKAITKEYKKQWEANEGANYSDPGGGGGGVDSGGKGGSRGVWNALRTGGLSAKQAAGVMGNIQHESGFSWNIKQGGAHSNNPSSTSAGYGLVQWTPGHKLTDILKKMGKKNSLENQIAALFHQLSGKGPHAEGHAGSMLRQAHSVFAATKAFLRGYERAADTSDSAVSRRNKASEHWYKKYHNAPLPSSGGGGDPGESGGKGMSAAKEMGYRLGAKPINRHSDPSGKPSYDMMIQNKTEGNNIAANLKKFHKDYGMEYVIWNMKIASNRENWNWRKYHPITNQGDYKHVHHVHSTYHGGTDAATPGWSLVGEQGPEFIKTRGGERILNAIQSKYAVMAAKAGQVVHAGNGTSSITNNSFDHSVQVASVTVKAESPRAMIAELEREARLAALTGVGK